MYELDYTPERLDWNKYFTRYKETQDKRFFREFLHFYEPVLDRKTKRFIERYELEDFRAEDLKQIFSFLLWEEYIRVNCGNFQTDNRHQYLLLKDSLSLLPEEGKR